MRIFALQRDEDESGVSGTGRVGEVAEFPNGKAVLQWSANTLAGVPSMSIFDSLKDLETVHGHGGKTRLVEVGNEGDDKPELLTRERLNSLFAEFSADLEEVHTFTLGQLEANFAEGVFAEGDLQIPYVDVSGRLFHTGKHRGIDYTEKRLDEMVGNFAEPAGELDWDVPVQLDHSDSAKDTVGHVRKLWRTDGDLMGTFRFVGAESVKAVKQRLWKKLSAGIRLGPTFSVKEASVTPFPFLKNAKLFKEQAEKHKEVSEMETNTGSKPADQAATTTTSASAAGGAQTGTSQETAAHAEGAKKKPFPPKPDDEEGKKEDAMSEVVKAEIARQLAEEQAKFNERTKKLEEQFAEREAKIKAQEEVARFKELTSKVERFCESGKSTPAMRDAELELVKSFSDEQLTKYEALKALQPDVVDFSVRGIQTTTERPGSPSDAEIQKHAEDNAGAGLMVAAHKK